MSKYLLVLVLLSFNITSAQYSWKTVTLPTGGTVKTIMAIDSTTLLCGNKIGLFISTNQGLQWNRDISPTYGFGLYDIQKFCRDTLGNIYADAGGSIIVSNVNNIKNSIAWNKLVIYDGITHVSGANEFIVTPSGNIFAASMLKRIYFSSDHGATWTRRDAGLPPEQYIWHLMRLDNDILFAVTDSCIYKSIDDGKSWFISGLEGVVNISIGISKKGVLYAGNWDLYSSLDTGKTWKIIAPRRNSIQSITIDDSDHVFLGLYKGVFSPSDSGRPLVRIDIGLNQLSVNEVNELIIVENKIMYAATSQGVYSSIDYGKNWSPANGGLTNIYVYNFTQKKDSLIFAGTSDGVFKSTDYGYHWDQTNNVTSSVHVSSGLGGEIYAYSGYNFQRSTDDGQNWTDLQQSLSGATVQDLCIDSTTGNCYIATSKGIKLSGDTGSTWQSFDASLDAIPFSQIICSSTKTLFASQVNDAGDIYKLNDEVDRKWEKKGMVGQPVRALLSIGNELFFAGTGIGVFISSDAGMTWTNIGLKGIDSSASIVNTLEYDGSNVIVGTGRGCYYLFGLDSIVNVGGAYIHTSLNKRLLSTVQTLSSISWELTIEDNIQGLLSMKDRSICAGGSSGRIYRGRLSHLPVLRISNTRISIGSVKVGQFKDTIITIANKGNDTLKISNMVSSSNNCFARPTIMNIPPGQSFTDTLRFAPNDIVTTSWNILVYSNASSSPDTIKLTGNGTMTGIVDLLDQIPKVYSLSQNYPNPFNPSTTIYYGLPVRSTVRLAIYNILGQVVKELINTEQQAGNQSVVWNANVASGLYFYRISATSIIDPLNRFVESRKMLLLR